MPVPPPLHDPAHLEARLLAIAEALDAAVAEVHQAMEEIKNPGVPIAPPPDTTGGTDERPE